MRPPPLPPHLAPLLSDASPAPPPGSTATAATLPLPSFVAAVVQLFGVLVLLSHPRCRQHAHASAALAASAILSLCESVLTLQALEADCTEQAQRLTASLLSIAGWCLAALPLAVAVYVQGQAAPASEGMGRAKLLVTLGAVYLGCVVGSELCVRVDRQLPRVTSLGSASG